MISFERIGAALAKIAISAEDARPADLRAEPEIGLRDPGVAMAHISHSN